MGFQILPNSLGSLGAGSSLSQLTGPLGSLFSPSTINNLVYPSDLASNPAMCHAIQFSIYDYTTGFEEAVSTGVGTVQNAISASGFEEIKNTINNQAEFQKQVIANIKNNSASAVVADEGIAAFEAGQVGGVIQKVIPSAVKSFQAPTYRPKRKGTPLANISLYMPDSLQTSHNAQYSEVSFTDAVGAAGILANAYADLKDKKAFSDMMNYLPSSGVGKTAIANIAGNIGSKLGGNATELSSIAKNALGVYTNPQIQLIYKGIGLREFSLSFVFTPKSPQEAQTTKNIIDTFTYYSVPGLGSAAIDGQPGQYLTPPQLFQVKFVFLGQNGIGGSIANVFNSALSNLGLNSLLTSNPTSTITNAAAAKVMTIQECVLESVSVDYAPNGWSAFNDGYPVQTTLSLQFKETQILTKKQVGEYNPSVASNYSYQQQNIKTASTYGTTAGSQQTALLQQQNEGF